MSSGALEDIMRGSSSVSGLVLFVALAMWPSSAAAQSLGTFRWQTQPYCNVITVSVAQTGSVYTLDGFDDQCGHHTRAAVSGTAFPNPDGTIGIGVTIVVTPGGTPLHLDATLSVATVGGSWRDSAGAHGAFVFNPANVSGAPRPTPTTAFPAGIAVGTTSLGTDGGIAARGQEIPESTIPYSKGTRMVWNPGKGAFRAGGLFQLTDDDKVGLFSVAMGYGSTASGRSSIALGQASASGDVSVALGGAGAHAEHALAIGFVTGAYGKDSVAIGSEALAAAANSVALGVQARSHHVGAIVVGDGGSAVNSTAANQLTIRARGGTRLFSNLNMTSGVQLAPNANAWSSLSDVNSKEHFRDLDGADVLAKIARLPIREWSYKAQDAAIRHVGPTAQDFRAAFGLGEDPLRISTIDADGIALAAVQALEARTREANDALVRENAALRAQLEIVLARLDAVERLPR